MKSSWRALTGLGDGAALLPVTALLAQAPTGPAPAVTAARALPAGDGPPGFWWGTDSLPVTMRGRAPYQMPYLGGAYGGYIGMTGNWAYWLGCQGTEHFLAFSATDNAQAHTDHLVVEVPVGDVGQRPRRLPLPPGVGLRGRPVPVRVHPRAAHEPVRPEPDARVVGDVVWIDVELPGIGPAPGNGSNSVYTSPCSGAVKQSSAPAAVDRADFNGFAAYIAAHSSYKVGVYSSAGVWASIFGTGTDSLIQNTYERTYEPETTNFGDAPYGCLNHGAGACAQFFGGQPSSSPYALMRQWSGSGGVSNGGGDFDTLDAIRQP
jgi:hypothetical protein